MSEYRGLIRNETDPIKSGIRRSTVYSYGTAPSSLLKNVNAQNSSGRHDITQAQCIKHVLQAGETLQGIALRYGCSTHDIRRVNRLLITDNIHLRESLLIPVPSSSNADASSDANVFTGGESNNEASGSSEPSSSYHVDYVDECDDSPVPTDRQQSGIDSNSPFQNRMNRDRQPGSTLPKSRSEYVMPSTQGNNNNSLPNATRSSTQAAALNSTSVAADVAATQKFDNKQFFEKYDQFLAGIRPSVNKMEVKTGQIAKEYSANSMNGSSSPASSSQSDAPSSTLLYRSANEVGKSRLNGTAATQRPPVNGAQQNGSSIFSRWFSFRNTQSNSAAVRRPANYVVTGYQSELEHEEPTSLANRTDDSEFYAI